jgi:hypothetical protein
MSAEAPRLETPCHAGSGTVVSHDATRPCRDNTVARQGVWHARGNRATADGVTGASVRGHRLGDSVAPRCRGGAQQFVNEEVSLQIRCVRPFMVGLAFRG